MWKWRFRSVGTSTTYCSLQLMSMTEQGMCGTERCLCIFFSLRWNIYSQWYKAKIHILFQHLDMSRRRYGQNIHHWTHSRDFLKISCSDRSRQDVWSVPWFHPRACLPRPLSSLPTENAVPPHKSWFAHFYFHWVKIFLYLMVLFKGDTAPLMRSLLWGPILLKSETWQNTSGIVWHSHVDLTRLMKMIRSMFIAEVDPENSVWRGYHVRKKLWRAMC